MGNQLNRRSAGHAPERMALLGSVDGRAERVEAADLGVAIAVAGLQDEVQSVELRPHPERHGTSRSCAKWG